MKTLAEILNSFNQPFDEYLDSKPVYSKGSKSGEVDYITWHGLCEILDIYAPGWEWEVTAGYHGNRTVIVGKLTIHGSDGSITRSATGNETEDCGSYGDPLSNAEAMAMRRACAKFGIGRYLWSKDKPQQQQQQKQTYQKQNYQQSYPKNTTPTAKPQPQQPKVNPSPTPSQPVPKPPKVWDNWQNVHQAIQWGVSIIPDADYKFLENTFLTGVPKTEDKAVKGQWWVSKVNEMYKSGEYTRNTELQPAPQA